jgi:hypothetical protein
MLNTNCQCQAHQMASGSTTDIFSSPIHRSMLTSIGVDWVNIYMTLAHSSDSEENSTLMGELISICLRTFSSPSPLGMSGDSTTAMLILTSKEYDGHLGKLGSTQGRTGTYCWMTQQQSPLTLGEALREAGTISGLRSAMQQTASHFLRLARRWLRESSAVPSPLFVYTQIGNTLPSLMNAPRSCRC